MLKQLLAATAIVTIASAAQAASAVNTDTTAAATATPAITAPAASGDMIFPTAVSGDRLASKLIGTAVYDGTGTDANKIGTINDLVIADNGSVEAVVVGVGGFLGIGQKNVALEFPNLQWSNRDGGPILVAAISKDELSNAASFDTAAIDNSQTPANIATDASQVAQDNGTAATTSGAATGTLGLNGTNDAQLAQQNSAGTASGTVAPTDQTQMAQQNPSNGATAGAPNENDLTAVDLASVTAKDLMNATVYSATNENVGNVGDVVLGQDGKIDALVLDVGGFLGLGTKPVAIGFDSLDIRKDANGGLFVYTHFTKDQLEAAPNYDKDQYASQRDMMRLSSP